MVEMTVTLTPETLATLAKLEKDTPTVYRRAFGFAASLAARKIKAAVRKGGGVDGIPAFQPKDPLTVHIHKKGNWYGSIGKGRVIRAWRDGCVQRVGWVWGLADFVKDLQERKTKPFTKEQRHWMHQRGLADVPRMYSRPARLVIDPFSEFLNRGEFARWVAGAAENISNGKIRTPERHAVSQTRAAKRSAKTDFESANHGR